MLDCNKGVATTTDKTRFFCQTPWNKVFLKKREVRGQKHHHFYTVIWVLKTGRNVVPPFWAPKMYVLKFAEAPICKAFPGTLVVAICLEKAILEKRQK